MKQVGWGARMDRLLPAARIFAGRRDDATLVRTGFSGLLTGFTPRKPAEAGTAKRQQSPGGRFWHGKRV